MALRRQSGGQIEVALSDDGVGFAPDAAAAGRGLSNMRTRADRIGARFEVLSDASGSRIALYIVA